MSVRDAYVSERKYRSYTSENLTSENKHISMRSDQRSTKPVYGFWRQLIANDWQKVTKSQDGVKFVQWIRKSSTNLQVKKSPKSKVMSQ